MKRTFKLEGLECANCAAKIEKEVSKIEGVTTALVNFMTCKLIIEGDESKMDAISEKAALIVKKAEAHVKMQQI